MSQHDRFMSSFNGSPFSLPTSDAKVKKEGFEIPFSNLQKTASMGAGGGGSGRDEFMNQSSNSNNMFGISNMWSNTISASHFGRNHDFGGITDEDLSSITNGGSNFGFNPLANNSHLGHQSYSAPAAGGNNNNNNIHNLFSHPNFNNSLEISTGIQASPPSSFGQSGSYNSMFDQSHRHSDAFYSNTPDTSVSTIPPSSIRSQSRSSNGGKVPSARSRMTKKTNESSGNSSTSPYSTGSPHLPNIPGHGRRPSAGAQQSLSYNAGGGNPIYSMDTTNNEESAIADDDLPPVTKTKAEILAEKKKKRRESHNEVERRRRDNINERITELSDLLPDNIESLANNFGVPFTGILSPVITQSTLHEEDDHGISGGKGGEKGKANKGDVLKHSVDYIKYLQQLVEAQNKQLQLVAMASSPASSQGGMSSLQPYSSSSHNSTSLPNFASPDHSQHLNFNSWVDSTASPETMEAISADEGERGRPLMRHSGMEE